MNICLACPDNWYLTVETYSDRLLTFVAQRARVVHQGGKLLTRGSGKLKFSKLLQTLTMDSDTRRDNQLLTETAHDGSRTPKFIKFKRDFQAH